jgi:hypothetical protein
MPNRSSDINITYRAALSRIQQHAITCRRASVVMVKPQGQESFGGCLSDVRSQGQRSCQLADGESGHGRQLRDHPDMAPWWAGRQPRSERRPGRRRQVATAASGHESAGVRSVGSRFAAIRIPVSRPSVSRWLALFSAGVRRVVMRVVPPVWTGSRCSPPLPIGVRRDRSVVMSLKFLPSFPRLKPSLPESPGGPREAEPAGHG